MRAVWTLCTLALCAASTGCLGFLYTTDVYGGWGVFANSFRSLAEAPVYGADQVVITCRNCQLANQAWAEFRKNCPSPPPPPDFACGFKAGFEDFLDAGGTGEPPAVPPYCYRLSCYQTPEGQRAVDAWFAGFREGAAAARASGLRDLFVVPVSNLPVRNERPYLPVVPTSPAGGGHGPDPAQAPVLPPPKEMQQGDPGV
jgi:hypothetical protein